MKVFISQPMRDKTDEEIVAERYCAIEHVEHYFFKADIDVIDSYFENAPHDASPLWYLGESIKKMEDADVVYFCKDWQKYNGCVIEHECAVRYGKKIIYA